MTVAVLKSHLRASWVEVNSRDILVSAHATGVTFQMLSHSRFARGQTLNPVDFDLSGRFRREVNLRYSFGEGLTSVAVLAVNKKNYTEAKLPPTASVLEKLGRPAREASSGPRAPAHELGPTSSGPRARAHDVPRDWPLCNLCPR